MADRVRTPRSSCPHCGYRMNTVSRLSADVPPPNPGDFGVCFGCGETLVFDRRLRLRKITAAEVSALDPDEAAELRQTQQTIREFLASGR